MGMPSKDPTSFADIQKFESVPATGRQLDWLTECIRKTPNLQLVLICFNVFKIKPTLFVRLLPRFAIYYPKHGLKSLGFRKNLDTKVVQNQKGEVAAKPTIHWLSKVHPEKAGWLRRDFFRR